MKPILRWAGSKRRLVGTLSDLWRQAGAIRYVEPFAGSAALYCEIEPEDAILGDANEELIGMYRTVRHDPATVSSVIRRWKGTPATFERVRAMSSHRLRRSVRAARFLYLNRWCFNGLYRTNRHGRFNVPFGGLRVGPAIGGRQLRQFAGMLRGARLCDGDFASTIALARRGDFVYLDPPYSVKGKRMFNEYVAGGFGESDLIRLASCIRALDQRGAKFVLSYADSFEGRELARNFFSVTVAVQRNVGGFQSRRRVSRELLVMNWEANVLVAG